jgi:hypothetical protein
VHRRRTGHGRSIRSTCVRRDDMRLNLAAPLGCAAPDDEWSGSGLSDALPVAVIEPSDVSNVIVWLVSDAARYATGVTLPLLSAMCMVLISSSEQRWPKRRRHKEQAGGSGPTAYADRAGVGSREASMFRSLPKHAIAWLVGVLGPPPSPPRRYFSKAWDERVRQRGSSR